MAQLSDHPSSGSYCEDAAAYRRVLESLGYALCVVQGPQFTVCAWSEEMARLTGVSAPEALGRPLDKAWPRVQGTLFWETWQLAARHGAPTCAETPFPGEDGRSRLLEARAEPLAEGQLLLLLRDASLRTGKDSDALRADGRYRRLFQADPDAVFLLSRELNVIDANPAAAALIESSRAGMLNRAISTILPGLDVSLLGSVRTDADTPSTMRLRRGDDQHVDLAVHSGCLGQGEERMIVLRLRDITAQRRVEEARWQSDERFYALVEAAEDIIFVVDNAQHILFLNSRTLEHLGRGMEELGGQTLGEVFGAEFGDLHQIRHDRLIDGDDSSEYEMFLDLPGLNGWFHTILVPIRNQQGTVIAATGISRDMSDARRLHEQMLEAERLATAQRMAGAVSHEFAQPLQALQLMAEGILHSLHPEQARDLTRIIDRIHKLVERVQRLSRVETKPYGQGSIIDLERSAPGSEEPSRRVLIVDDEELIRELLQAVVEQFGLEVVTASQGEAGLEQLGKQEFGLVLCDIAMPVMNGINFMRKAQRAFPDLPVVLMSGYTINDEDSDAMRQASGFLPKPFGVDKVRELLERVFGELSAPSSRR